MSEEPHIFVAPLREADIASLHSAMDAVSKEGRFMAHLSAPPIVELSARIREAVASEQPFYVARDGHTVVGWCEIVAGDAETCRGHVGTLSMGILDSHRGKGLGTQLIELAVTDAAAKGMTRIQLLVRASNTGAVAMYEKAGFVIEGTQKFATRYDGVYDDLCLMALLTGELAA